ncbi:MAG: DarT ssDNA thymidine ADP-ribosyltransferase family protein [Intestinibacter sp.]|uniref:DarT ssDNA thymidine ADP-ribosyltransferase family protein n=1 Tax=Intestinibacter sp. TaxID=1965304 RepID=UPI002A80807D|nr:DarT ssDNA thymidine ADP-ribosyltransferase family protein [Intestinibacter sp.]MDY4576248.1 DarT ssDNA thymidine ADP-ribosyltransferase family protein [Intestinibacter sp.]
MKLGDLRNINRITTKAEKVEQLKRDYNFKGLYHFTDFSNLEQIFKSGYLYSRNESIQKFGGFQDGADPKMINKLRDLNRLFVMNCVRFYYRPKTPTLYRNEGVKLEQYCNNIHIPMPVYLLFDESLIYSKDVIFSDGNTTSKYTKIDDTNDFFINKMDWKYIFKEGHYFEPGENYSDIEKWERGRKRQAELLSLNPVSIEKYLKKIIFRCEADKKRAINVYGHSDKYEVDINLFSDKDLYGAEKQEDENNFIIDYDIDYEFDENGKKNKIIFIVEYNKSWKDYKTSFNIYDLEGLNLKDSINEFYKKYITSKTIEYEPKKIRGRANLNFNKNNNYNDKKILKIEGDIDKFSKFEIYINNFLYIEEFLKKENLLKYEIDDDFKLHVVFKNKEIVNCCHKYQILDKENKIVDEGFPKFKMISNKKNDNYKHYYIDLNLYTKAYKIKYYVDNVMYICDLLSNIK